MDRKQKIENNFSKASKTYNIATPIQKMSAERVINMINKVPTGNILEIGAGTGHLTELLVKKFPDNQIFVNDISEAMLKELCLNIALNDNVTTFVADAEKLQFERGMKFDLITSSSVFQWFENYSLTFTRLNRLLNIGGELIFSMYGKNSLQELNDTFKLCVPGHKGNLEIKSLYAMNELLQRAGFDVVFFDQQQIKKQFLSLTEIIQNQKLSGAVNVDSNSAITKKQWVNIIKEYNSKYTKNDGVYATYHLYYFKAVKRE